MSKLIIKFIKISLELIQLTNILQMKVKAENNYLNFLKFFL